MRARAGGESTSRGAGAGAGDALDAESFEASGRRYRVPPRPVLAICADGTDPAYLEDALHRGLMPRLSEALDAGGTYAVGEAQVPTFTNPNNCCIACGVSAAVHGISGNFHLSPDGRAVALTDPADLRAPTIHAAAREAGVPVLCVTAKDKLRALLASGDVPAVSAERADAQTLPGLDGHSAAAALGRPNPGIYDPELSPYTIDLALRLAELTGARLVYASLTDYVQHTAAPGTPLADGYCSGLDQRLGRALDEGWIVGFAADHGMSPKAGPTGEPNVRYLEDALDASGVTSGQVILPITDAHVVHHAALGSLAWVHVGDDERDEARGALAALQGVEGVLDRGPAAAVFELPPDRIGDLLVLADRDTVLGSSRGGHDLSALHGPLRSHGGLHERHVPIAVLNPLAPGATAGRRLRNADLHDLLLNHVS